MKLVNLKILGLVVISVSSCSTSKKFKVSDAQVQPGTKVFAGSTSIALYEGSLKVGDDLATIGSKHGLDIPRTVAIISIVPSIDTPVCEEQTHILGESNKIHPGVKRIVISRDLPMAQSRFAADGKLQNITYLSDYKTGSFGKSTGLMMKDKELLARAVIVTDKNGVIQYLELVKDITTLPNMMRAIEKANSLL